MRPHYTPVLALALSTALCLAVHAYAQDEAAPDGSTVRVTVEEGQKFAGKLVEQDALTITVVTQAGVRLVIPRSEIRRLEIIDDVEPGHELWRSDPNYSRLMYAPTARPLRKGDGYFSNHYIFFPGVAVGITNFFSLYAGMSLIPGVSPSEQVFYIAPRLGVQVNDKFAASVGTLVGHASESTAGLIFGVVTLGNVDASITGGLALGFVKDQGDDYEFADDLVYMIGGSLRLSNSAALITENWLFAGNNFKASEQPLAIAVRAFGDRIAFDIGFVVIGEVVQEGVPIPWLGVVYNFGR